MGYENRCLTYDVYTKIKLLSIGYTTETIYTDIITKHFYFHFYGNIKMFLYFIFIICTFQSPLFWNKLWINVLSSNNLLMIIYHWYYYYPCQNGTVFKTEIFILTIKWLKWIVRASTPIEIIANDRAKPLVFIIKNTVNCSMNN